MTIDHIMSLLATAVEPLDIVQLISRKYDNPDPAGDTANFFGYVPQIKYTVIALVAFLLVAMSQTYLMVRHKGYFMLAMLIAEFTFAAGIAVRWPMHDDPTKKGLYIIQNTLIVLSPCGFIAANYMLLGRIARWLRCSSHMLVRPQRITLFFVLSDVFTFLIQGSGGGLSASAGDDASKAKLGARIFLIGLILQGVSFAFFTFMYLHFLYCVYTRESRIWNADANKSWLHDWRGLAGALFTSCIFILIRSGYRIAELSQGYRGPISEKEGLFYLFDVLCLFLAVLVYTVFWPGRFIPGGGMEKVLTEDSDKFEGSRIAMLDAGGQGMHTPPHEYRSRPMV